MSKEIIGAFSAKIEMWCICLNLMKKYYIFHLQFFLAVANQGPRRDRPSKSVIYRWSKKRKRFGVFQELVTWTSRDVEYFQIENQHYLAVANHVQGKE